MDKQLMKEWTFGIFVELLHQKGTTEQTSALMDQAISLALQLSAKIECHQKKLESLEKEIYYCIKQCPDYDITKLVTERGWHKWGILVQKYYYMEVQYSPSNLEFELYAPQLDEKGVVCGTTLAQSGSYTEKHSFTRKWKEFIYVVDKVYQNFPASELPDPTEINI